MTISEGVLALGPLGDFSSPANVAIDNSLVLQRGSRTLTSLTKYTGQGVDYGVEGWFLNLEDEAIAIGSTPGTRWFFYSGASVSGGAINSLDGTELVPTPPPAISGYRGAKFTDIELNADARVPEGATLAFAGALTGTGRLIVDGGKLELGVEHTDSTATVRAALSRIEPHAGVVAITGTIVNHGETLWFPTGVRWGYSHLRSNGIVGGRVDGEPGAVLHVDRGYGGFGSNYATFKEGVTIALPVVVNNTYAFVRGGLTLDSTHLTLGVTNTPRVNPSGLVFFNQQTLVGVGEVRFGPTPSSAPHIIEIPSDAGSLAGLTVGAGITVRTAEGNGVVRRGLGRSDILHATLTNHGLLLAENGHRLELYTEDFAQHGTLRSETESLLVVHDDDVINHGRLELAGGEMKFTGDLTQAPGSVLAVELSSDLFAGGVAPLVVEGNAILGGGLEISLAEGFAANPGDRFALLSAATLVGRFTSIVGPALDEGLFWRPETVGGELWLSVADGPLPGDYNFDGVVNAADYTVWRNDLGATGPGLVADADGDREVDAGDYEVWRANYGSGDATLGAAAGVRVPEPAGWSVLLTIIVVTTASRRMGWMK